MKKSGFTLVELLAVIVILGIISVIATSNISNVINKVKVNSFASSFKILNKSLKDKVSLGDNNIECDDGNVNNTCFSIYDYDEKSYEMKVEKHGNIIISRLSPKNNGLFSKVFNNVKSFVDIFDDNGDMKCTNLSSDIIIECEGISLMKKEIDGQEYLVEMTEDSTISYENYESVYKPLMNLIDKIKKYEEKENLLCSDLDSDKENNCINKLGEEYKNYMIAITKPYDKYFVHIWLPSINDNVILSNWTFEDNNIIPGNDDVSFLMDEKGNTTTHDTGNLYFYNIKVENSNIEKQYDKMYYSFMKDIDKLSFNGYWDGDFSNRINQEDLWLIKKELDDFCENKINCIEEQINNNYKISDTESYSLIINMESDATSEIKLDLLPTFSFENEKIPFEIVINKNGKLVFTPEEENMIIKPSELSKSVFLSKYQYLYYAFDISHKKGNENNPKWPLIIRNLYTVDSYAENNNILRIRGEWNEKK